MSVVNVSARQQLVVFLIGEDVFGMSIQLVREIIKETKVVRIPNLPSHIKGVLNLRGLVIPIVNLAEQLGVDTKNIDTEERKVLIVEHKHTQVGYLVNEVLEVLSVPGDALEEPTSFFGSVDHRVVEAICKLGERLFPVLNMNRILDESALDALDDLAIESQRANIH